MSLHGRDKRVSFMYYPVCIYNSLLLVLVRAVFNIVFLLRVIRPHYAGDKLEQGNHMINEKPSFSRNSETLFSVHSKLKAGVLLTGRKAG